MQNDITIKTLIKKTVHWALPWGFSTTRYCLHARLNRQWSKQMPNPNYPFSNCVLFLFCFTLDIVVWDGEGEEKVHISILYIVQRHCPLDRLAPDLKNCNYTSAKTHIQYQSNKATYHSPCTRCICFIPFSISYVLCKCMFIYCNK